MDLPELTQEDAALLAQFRIDESPSAMVADRVHRRLRARLAAHDATPSLLAKWSLWLRAAGLTVAIAAAVLLVVAGSSRLIGRLTTERELPAASDTVQRRTSEGVATPRAPAIVVPEVATPPAHRDVVAPTPEATTATPAEWPSMTDALDATRDRPRAGKPASTATAPALDAAAEIQLVSAAKAEKDPQARLELIRRHGREFGGGKLGREVAILEIQTLCALGKRDDAQARAKSFVERNPGSAYATIAARACEEPKR